MISFINNEEVLCTHGVMRMDDKKNKAAFYKLPISLKSFTTDFKIRNKIKVTTAFNLKGLKFQPNSKYKSRT